jgi:RNA polymerase sigma-70 factor (ECF subfamily)
LADGEKPLDAWVHATLPQALAFAASLLRDRAAAEDVVHDCYCRLLQKADVYDLPRDGVKILMRAVANACIDWQGRGRLRVSLGLLAAADGQPADPRAVEPPRQAMARELGQAVEAGLAALPFAQRAALRMKSADCSLQEIAEALGVSVSNAGVLVHRARQAMSEHLAPYLKEEAR